MSGVPTRAKGAESSSAPFIFMGYNTRMEPVTRPASDVDGSDDLITPERDEVFADA